MGELRLAKLSLDQALFEINCLYYKIRSRIIHIIESANNSWGSEPLHFILLFFKFIYQELCL